MLKNRLDRILTWFSSPISNGTPEGFNSRIQAIKSPREAFGSLNTIVLEFSSTAENSAQNHEKFSHKNPRRTKKIRFSQKVSKLFSTLSQTVRWYLQTSRPASSSPFPQPECRVRPSSYRAQPARKRRGNSKQCVFYCSTCLNSQRKRATRLKPSQTSGETCASIRLSSSQVQTAVMFAIPTHANCLKYSLGIEMRFQNWRQ